MSTDKFHALQHLNPDRFKIYASSNGIDWSDELEAWMIFDPGLILSVLQSEDFKVSMSSEEIAALGQKLKVDLSAIEQVTDHMPVAHEGHVHSCLRKSMALLIGKNSDAALHSFRAYLSNRAETIFATEGNADLFRHLLAPGVAILMSALCELDLAPMNEELAPSQILDRLLSANRRKLINNKIAKIMDAGRDKHPGENIALRTAMAVLGSDTLLATLSENLIYALERNPDSLLSEICWEVNFILTGAPYIERTAIKNVLLQDARILPGQRLRLYLDVFGMSNAIPGDSYFGVGKHACLGRSISLKVWNILTTSLSRYKKRVELREVIYRKPDYMFRFPSSIKVCIHNEQHRTTNH